MTDDIKLPPLPRLRVPLIEADVDLLDIKVLARWCERTATDYARAAVMPMVVPSVRLFWIGRVGVRLAFVPKIEKNGSHVLHAMIEWDGLK